MHQNAFGSRGLPGHHTPRSNIYLELQHVFIVLYYCIIHCILIVLLYVLFYCIMPHFVLFSPKDDAQ